MEIVPPPNDAAASASAETADTTTLAETPDANVDEAATETAAADLPDPAALAAKIAELESQLGSAAEKITGYEAVETQRTAAEIDALLAGHAELSDSAKAALKNVLTTDRAAGEAILADMKNPAPAAPAAAAPAAPNVPPTPTHDPKAETQMSDADKVAKLNPLIAAIRKEGKFKDYTSARDEARRRQPDLFA